MSTIFAKSEKLTSSKLNQAFDDKADVDHNHTAEDISDFDEAISGKANVEHDHDIDDVNGLGDALDGKSDKGHGHEMGSISGLTSALSGKANATHTHGMSQVTGLVGALSDLSDAVDGKAEETHSHDADDLPIASEEEATLAVSNTTLLTPLRAAQFLAFKRQQIPDVLGQPFGGGYYAGRVALSSGNYLIILAPKAQGESSSIRWASTTGPLSHANTSDFDSADNHGLQIGTVFLLANWARGLNIGGYQDWMIPAFQVLRQIYANLGDVPPSEYFGPQEGFSSAYYWSSTQAANSGSLRASAKAVHMAGGSVFTTPATENFEKNTLRAARAIRLINI